MGKRKSNKGRGSSRTRQAGGVTLQEKNGSHQRGARGSRRHASRRHASSGGSRQDEPAKLTTIEFWCCLVLLLLVVWAALFGFLFIPSSANVGTSAMILLLPVVVCVVCCVCMICLCDMRMMSSQEFAAASPSHAADVENGLFGSRPRVVVYHHGYLPARRPNIAGAKATYTREEVMGKHANRQITLDGRLSTTSESDNICINPGLRDGTALEHQFAGSSLQSGRETKANRGRGGRASSSASSSASTDDSSASVST